MTNGQAGHSGQRDDSHPVWDGMNGMRFHHAACKGIQLKTYKLVIYGIFHLIYLTFTFVGK